MQRRMLLSALLLLGSFGLHADPAADLRSVVTAMVAKGVPGAALCVDDPVQGHWVVAAGVADQATGRALQPTDRFRIASISKTFTGAAILLLRDEGRLDLDTPIRSYLPEWDIPGADVITIRHLLTHTSGLPDHNNDADEIGQIIVEHPETIITATQVFDLVRRLPAHFSPGAAWSYTDTGFYILGLIVAKRNAEGLSLGEFIQKRFLTPLGLNNTFVPGPANNYLYQIPGEHAHGYNGYEPGGPLQDMTALNQSWDVGCGGMVSNVEDLTRWVRLLYSGQVLSAASTTEMKTITPQSIVATGSLGVTCGMATFYRITTGFGHGGTTSGFQSEMQYDPVHQTASAGFINVVSADTLTVMKPFMVAAKRALGYPGQIDPGYARLANASGRGLAGTGEETLVLGFTFGGTETKSLSVRAAGPALRNFGVTSALADPRVQVLARGTVVAANDNWDGAADTVAAWTRVGAFLFPSGSKDAAVVAALPPGSYSAMVGSGDGSSGVVLAEIYDAQALAGGPSRMANISVRGVVGNGAAELTAGFVVVGNAPLRVVIRGIGPALSDFGVANAARDPQLTLYSGQTVIAQNDNWDGTAATAALLAQTGAFALTAGSKDAVLVTTLNPGAYTVSLRGPTTDAGRIGLIEVYDAKTATDYAATQQQVRDYVQRRMRETGVVGVSVALVESDGVILQDGFGYRDRAKTMPVTAETPFSIGSVSKTMAAMMTMQLVADEKLDLDAPLSAVLPEFAIHQRFPASAPITLRSILAHHSGLPGDMFNGAFTTAPVDRWNDYLLGQLAQEYTQRPVGEMWAYNNSGYVILQNVIERASGLSLEEYSRRFFFGPAGMAGSTFGNNAPGWSATFSDGEPLPTEYVNAGTAGSVKAPAVDMARYLRVLLHDGLGEGERVLAPSAFAQMGVRQYPDNAIDAVGGIFFGLGFRLGLPGLDYAGNCLSHDGETVAFHSQLIVLKDQGLGVFVSSNTASPDSFADDVARGILQIALQNLRGLGTPAGTRPASAMVDKPRAELAAYAGKYAPGFSGYDTFVATDQGLQWTRGAGGASPATTVLLARADGRFATADGNLQVEFQTVAGRSLAILFVARPWWTDHYILGEKIAPAAPSSAWQNRVGEYVWVNQWPIDYLVAGDASAMTVRLDFRDGVLLLGAPGGDPDVIVPETDALAFTTGVGFGLGRNRGDAVRVEKNGTTETLWFRGKAARRVGP